jgi:hypothetical protein
MFATARDQAELKKQSGHDARGRKNTKPVLHYSLSWAASENPSPEHMKETALSSLKAMGLESHQAVIAAHGDKDHLHVHIVVNTIHPETGLTAPLKYTKERLSRWAEAYEREHGIHCRERIANNAERDKAARARDGAAVLMLGNLHGQPGRMPYVPVKYRGPNRRQWFSQKDLKDRMSRLRAELDLISKTERSELWRRQEQARAAFDDNSQAAADHAKAYVKAQFKPQWRDLYRVQRREAKYVEGCTTVFERAVFVFGQRERLGRGKPLTVRQMLPLIRDQGKLLDRVEAVHERERRGLAQIEKAEANIYTGRIWTQHREKFDRLKSDQAAERDTLRQDHFARTRSVSLNMAKASLVADQQTASNDDARSRAQAIKEQMTQWRQRNQGKDFGREM